MPQKFRATEPYTFANDAIGWRPGGPFDCLGPFAKVQNCPITDTDDGTGKPIRRTCYATGYADTFFSVPACTRVKGKHIGGFFMIYDDKVHFVALKKFRELLPASAV